MNGSPEPDSMLANPVSDGKRQDAGHHRRAHQRVVLAFDMGAQGALAGDFGELAVDGQLAADDIVGDVEKLQGGAEIVGLERSGRPPSSPKRSDSRCAVGIAALDPAGLPDPAGAQQVGGDLAQLALRAEDQPIDPRIDGQRRRCRRRRAARRILDQMAGIDPRGVEIGAPAAPGGG